MQNLTNFDAALKELYTDDKVEKLVYEKFPLLALLPKDENFFGKYKTVPVYHGNPQGRSSTFARAQSRASSEFSRVVDFQVTRTKDYGFVQIDNETMEASSNDKGAFLKARETEIDGVISSLSQSLARQVVRSGWGDMGRIGSISTTTITLLDPEDIVHFEVGQELDLAAALDSGSVRAYGSSGNGLIITAVNRSAGTISFAANVADATDGIPTAAANDYIFTRGDRSASAAARLQIAGLEAWVPYVAPGATAFFGVDRTADVTRLAGLRKDVSTLPLEEGLLDGAATCAREGVSPNYYFMNPSKYFELVKALGSKVEYCDVKASAEIGFRGIVIHGQNGEIKVMSDPTIPSNRAYGLTIDSWELCSLGKLIKPLNSDGLEMLRLSSDDGVEVRYGYYANLTCKAPGKNIVLNV